MNIQQMKAAFKKAEGELIAADWVKILSVMHDGKGLAYGVLFTKDGQSFYLNRDTVMPSMTGPQMADACRPLFN